MPITRRHRSSMHHPGMCWSSLMSTQIARSSRPKHEYAKAANSFDIQASFNQFMESIGLDARDTGGVITRQASQPRSSNGMARTWMIWQPSATWSSLCAAPARNGPCTLRASSWRRSHWSRLKRLQTATPTLAIVDSQTVKSAEKGGQRLIRPDMTRVRKSETTHGRRYARSPDQFRGLARRRAGPQHDRAALGHCVQAVPLASEGHRRDGGYQGKPTADDVNEQARIPLVIVKRSDAPKGFYVLPKRWIVERTYGWLNRCRRLVKDYENLTRNHAAFIILAMIRLMLRRIVRHVGAT
jgi:transposase